jgi:hypothetical protein
MENWLILQNFYNRLTSTSKAHIDLLDEPSSHSLSIEPRLYLKRWSPTRGGVKTHSKPNKMTCIPRKNTNMLATKLDLQIKCLDEHDTTKEATYGAVQALNLHMTCEVCGNNGHSGNDCPKTHEDAWYNNNRSIHKEV